MLASDFARRLRRLNPKLRIACGDRADRLAGLYIIKDGEYEPICGVDKNYVATYPVFDDGGHIVHSGYRRVVWILLGNGYTTRRLVQSIWPGFFDSRACDRDRWQGGIEGDPIGNLIEKYSRESDALSKDQILDLGAQIRAKDTDEQKQVREEEKWFLETWKHNGGGLADKPKV